MHVVWGLLGRREESSNTHPNSSIKTILDVMLASIIASSYDKDGNAIAN